MMLMADAFSRKRGLEEAELKTLFAPRCKVRASKEWHV
jgi:hypothetical protein